MPKLLRPRPQSCQLETDTASGGGYLKSSSQVLTTPSTVGGRAQASRPFLASRLAELRAYYSATAGCTAPSPSTLPLLPCLLGLLWRRPFPFNLLRLRPRAHGSSLDLCLEHVEITTVRSSMVPCIALLRCDFDRTRRKS